MALQARNKQMANKRSVFEYDTVPFASVDLDTPVTQIMEMNDGYQILLAGKDCERIYESDSQHERGGIQVNEFSSLRDFLVEDMGAELEDGQLVFDDDTLEAVLERMTKDGDPVMGGGLLMVKKLAGTYRDPETLFMSFFDGEHEDEDEGVLCEEDCA
jgi:hypothetical protein